MQECKHCGAYTYREHERRIANGTTNGHVYARQRIYRPESLSKTSKLGTAYVDQWAYMLACGHVLGPTTQRAGVLNLYAVCPDTECPNHRTPVKIILNTEQRMDPAIGG